MKNKVDVSIRLKEDSNSIWTVKGGMLSYILDQKEISYKCFGSIFSQETNEDIYKSKIQGIIERFKGNENATIMAYGQTGSGKTYTMLGNSDGLIHMALKDLIPEGPAPNECLELSFIELFNERIFDLYTRKELKMYSLKDQTIINDVHFEDVKCFESALKFLKICEDNRATGITEFNDNSSRSHAVLKIRRKNAILNFIDLAGSERASCSHSRLKEGSYINKSLLALGKLVNNLLNSNSFGYRESKLTRILQPSMDGKTNLVALCMVSPVRGSLQESLSTLSFAARLSNLNMKIAEVKDSEKSSKSDKGNESIDFYKMNREAVINSKTIELYKKRVEDLENTIAMLLNSNPNKTILDIYILEKQMFNINLESLQTESLENA